MIKGSQRKKVHSIWEDDLILTFSPNSISGAQLTIPIYPQATILSSLSHPTEATAATAHTLHPLPLSQRIPMLSPLRRVTTVLNYTPFPLNITDGKSLEDNYIKPHKLRFIPSTKYNRNCDDEIKTGSISFYCGGVLLYELEPINFISNSIIIVKMDNQNAVSLYVIEDNQFILLRIMAVCVVRNFFRKRMDKDLVDSPVSKGTLCIQRKAIFTEGKLLSLVEMPEATSNFIIPRVPLTEAPRREVNDNFIIDWACLQYPVDEAPRRDVNDNFIIDWACLQYPVDEAPRREVNVNFTIDWACLQYPDDEATRREVIVPWDFWRYLDDCSRIGAKLRRMFVHAELPMITLFAPIILTSIKFILSNPSPSLYFGCSFHRGD